MRIDCASARNPCASLRSQCADMRIRCVRLYKPCARHATSSFGCKLARIPCQTGYLSLRFPDHSRMPKTSVANGTTIIPASISALSKSNVAGLKISRRMGSPSDRSRRTVQPDNRDSEIGNRNLGIGEQVPNLDSRLPIFDYLPVNTSE